MRLTRYSRIIGVMFVAVLAACSAATNGGSSGGGVTPNALLPNYYRPIVIQPLPIGNSGKRRGKARIRIEIPHKRHHKPKYISPSTQSMTVVTSANVPAQTFNLTPTSPGCSVSNGNTTCSIVAFLPVGSQTLTITLWDQTGGKGNQLSTADDPVTIDAGAVANISVTLDGVPATAVVLLGTPPSPSASVPQGTPTSVPVSVTAYDADQHIIMSPGGYSTPITLTDSDTSATSLSTSGTNSGQTVTVNAPGQAVTLSYTGGIISSATITPSINGTAQSSGAATLTLMPAGPPVITEYSVPTIPSNPLGITAGPDGTLWFTEFAANKIGRITTGATPGISEYSIPSSMSIPYGIAVGPDHALWFAESNTNKIGRITTGAMPTITEYSIVGTNDQPMQITAGPDGALWFTEFWGNKIGRITTGATPTITEYTIPTSSSRPNGIAAGSDGALWFVEFLGNKIGRITTNGVITEYPTPTSPSNPVGIAAGPDGALWFTEVRSNKTGAIGRITASASSPAITEYTIPTAESNPFAIAPGKDGAMWFTEYFGNNVGRITVGATPTITEYSIPTTKSEPYGIVAGGDGAMWFTECIEPTGKIGRIPLAMAQQARHRVHGLRQAGEIQSR